MLSAKGLLEARPKRGTIVCPPPQWNLLDPDVMVWKVRNGADEQYLRNWEEVRQIIEPQVVRLATTRRTDKDLAAMRTALERLSEVSKAARRKTADYITADLNFHHAILMATRNDLLVQLGAIMENALRQRDALVHRGSFNRDATFLDHHWSVFRAIGEQDEEGGERAMQLFLPMLPRFSKTCSPQRTGCPRRPVFGEQRRMLDYVMHCRSRVETDPLSLVRRMFLILQIRL